MTDTEALVWIRKKLGLPEDAQMTTGEETICGRLHEIARLTAALHEAHDRIAEFQAACEAFVYGTKEARECESMMLDAMSKVRRTPEQALRRFCQNRVAIAGDK